MEFIKSFENNIRKLPAVSQSAIRNRSLNTINNLPSYSVNRDEFEETLNRLTLATKKVLNSNKNLILTRADKGNVTVALDKDKYVREVENLLMDTDTYMVVERSPVKKLTNSLREILTIWKKSNFISAFTYKTLYYSDGILPRAYGLPKIHKPNCPFRVIVSSINSPLYFLATYLHKIMIKSFPVSHSHVCNSCDVVKKLSNTYLDNNFRLVSLDVISLFTNVPTDLIIDSVSSRWNNISPNCDIPCNEFLLAVVCIGFILFHL